MPNHFKRIVSKVLSKSKPLHVSFSFYNLRLEFSPLHIYFYTFTPYTFIFFFILASFNDKIYQSIRFVVFYVTSRTKEMRNQMESLL